MPVPPCPPALALSPKRSVISACPSPLVSWRATMAPPVHALSLSSPPRRGCQVLTYTTPLGATTRCRGWSSLSAKTDAQKPVGSVMPPLPASHPFGTDAVAVESAAFAGALSCDPPQAAIATHTSAGDAARIPCTAESTFMSGPRCRGVVSTSRRRGDGRAGESTRPSQRARRACRAAGGNRVGPWRIAALLYGRGPLAQLVRAADS